MIPEDFLEELRSRVSIAKIIGQKVAWDPRKSNPSRGEYWGLCPFHQEKTPSFKVDDQKGFYICFGCHAKGDAIKFLRETGNIGFMDAAAVAGDAAISVNIASMTGRADFTGLETWNPNAAPGAVGTGATWLDGDLGYTIAVRGNTFRETGGDAGTLTGIFTGRAHDGAAGTLERSDLTAAFVASR